LLAYNWGSVFFLLS